MSKSITDPAAIGRRKQIGWRLRVIQEALGLSASEMAAMAGVKKPRYSNWTGPKADLADVEAMMLIADETLITLDYIFRGQMSRDIPEDTRAKLAHAQKSVPLDEVRKRGRKPRKPKTEARLVDLAKQRRSTSAA